MANKKNKKVPKGLYNISKLLATGCNWMLLLGMRSNGKSYQVTKTILEDYIKDGTKFVYLRRWRDDINGTSVDEFFNNVDINKITNGKYDTVVLYSQKIFFAHYDDNGVVKRGEHIGYACNLNTAERNKSWSFNDVGNIAYEEFVPQDASYLVNEPQKLLQFVSTVFRLWEGHVFLIGNTLNRVNPYFRDWQLTNAVDMRQGDIQIYHMPKPDGGSVDLAVEMCSNVEFDNKMFFGVGAKSIVKGEWEVNNYPHLDYNYKDFEICYEMGVKYDSLRYVVQILCHRTKDIVCTYVYKLTSNRPIDRWICDYVSYDRLITKGWLPNKAEDMIRYDISQGKVRFCDNMAGSDFYHIMSQLRLMTIDTLKI